MSNIKSMLDAIIHDTNDAYPTMAQKLTSDDCSTKVFDKNAYREKLSHSVMKDILSSMMNDETKDIDHLIDDAIMKHVDTNYKGSCYGYLSQASKSLNGSPLVDNIIQEINAKTESCAAKIAETKDDSIADEEVSTNELLKDVANYDEFRDRVKDVVTQKVIKDVSNVVTATNDAPVFDNLDEKLNDVTSESVILKATGAIVTEYAIANKERISTEEGMNIAVVEYCIAEMDRLFKNRSNVNIYTKYA